MEIFIFNFKHWESYTFKSVDNYSITLGSGIAQISDNVYKVVDKGNAFFELTDINAELKNLHFDFHSAYEGYQFGKTLPITIQMTDDANSLYRTLASTEIVEGIKESTYIRLHLIGESTRIKVNIQCEEGELFCVNRIALNQVRPFVIHPARFVFMILIGILYLMFRSKSDLYVYGLDFGKRWQRVVIYFMVCLHLLLFGLIGISSLPAYHWEKDTWKAHAQYEHLADALLDGHFYLNDQPPEYLVNMENPYDSTLRGNLQSETGEEFLFDFAFYDGKYYCYFGIVPALLFFVPFKWIMGYHLQTWIPVVFCALLYCIVSFVFMYEIVKKYFKKISIGLYILMTSVFIAASEILYLAHFGNVYSMPIMLGLLLGITGLSFWIHASRFNPLKKRYLVLGALCIALIVGCRPQLAIVLLFAFPIFWEQIKAKEFFSKKGLANTCSVILPFCIIGVMLMYYNYARFGSPFDFGANYNLTSNDMTHKGIVMSRNFLGLYEYFLQPLNIKSKFPFWQTIDLQTEYQGYISSEPMLGGYLFMNLISVFSFGIFKFNEILKKQKIYALSFFSFVSAFIIVEATIQMSGLTQRYMSDFGWLFILPAIFVILSMHEQCDFKKQKYPYLQKITIILSIICIFTNYFSLFADGRYASLRGSNPFMFYIIKYMFFKC